RGEEQPADGFGFGGSLALYYRYPRRCRDRCKVFGGSRNFLIRHRPRKSSHKIRVALSLIRGPSGAALEIHQLPHEIFVRKAGEVGVFGPTLSIGIMARTTG